jgi:hypothetical protein
LADRNQSQVRRIDHTVSFYDSPRSTIIDIGIFCPGRAI